ncbi:MAG: trigger factor [Ignavibacteriaceae bacterium]|nr:trigger factor [Ignavibacteriaceae bacterium]
MEKNLKTIDEATQEIEIIVPADEAAPLIREDVNKRKRNLEIPGFRKGKVPEFHIKRMYGDSLEHLASEKVANSLFWKAVDELELKVMDEPVITALDYSPGGELKFSVKYSTPPIFEPKNYTGHEIKVPYLPVSDDDVTDELNSIAHRFALYTEKDEVENPKLDVIKVEYITGKELENFAPSSEKEREINPTMWSEAFLEELKGKKVGDSVKITNESFAKVPESNYDEIESGLFMYISKIQDIETPELTLELFKKVNAGIESVEAFKEKVKTDLEQLRKMHSKKQFRSDMDKILLENNDIKVPQVSVDRFLQNIVKKEMESDREKGRIFKQSMYEDYFRDSAKNSVKLYYIQSRIIAKENISISEDIIQAKAKKDSATYNLPVEFLLEYYRSEDQKFQIESDLYYDFLFENNNIIYVDPKEYKELDPYHDHHHHHDHDHDHNHDHDHEHNQGHEHDHNHDHTETKSKTDESESNKE